MHRTAVGPPVACSRRLLGGLLAALVLAICWALPAGGSVFAAPDPLPLPGEAFASPLCPAGAATVVTVVSSAGGPAHAPATFPRAAVWTAAAPTVVRVGAPLCLRVDALLAHDWQRFRWGFGDGQRATGPAVLHRWTAAGVYTVRLTALADGAVVSAVAVSVAVIR